MDISPKGLNFTAGKEIGPENVAAGKMPQLYNDVANNATVAVGHLVHHGPIDGCPQCTRFKAGISFLDGLALFKNDLQPHIAEVNSVLGKIPGGLTQDQFDALVDFCFNCGDEAFEHSSILRDLEAKDFKDVPAALEMWVKAGGKTWPGLVVRRGEEAKAFEENGQA